MRVQGSFYRKPKGFARGSLNLPNAILLPKVIIGDNIVKNT